MRYKITNYEFLKQLLRQVTENPSSYWKDYPCLEWPRGKNRAGYGVVSYKGAHHYGHRLSYELCVGTIPHGLLVCHHCDNPYCIRPCHLFIGTDADNLADCRRKGRGKLGKQQLKTAGSKNPSAKFTEMDIPVIRSMRAGGMSLRAIAEAMGVTRPAIGYILSGKLWRHIPIVAI